MLPIDEVMYKCGIIGVHVMAFLLKYSIHRVVYEVCETFFPDGNY